jgi:hypothetical protein
VEDEKQDMIQFDLELSERLASLEVQYSQFPESKKQRLTIPAIFGRSGDENFISDYLAYILDPERNGIGIEPLQALLALAYDDTTEIELDQITIKREYTFRNDPGYGRIDFIIELGENGVDGVIGIENKIYSSEGDNQTRSYLNGIRKDYRKCKHYLIFLTPEGRLPSSEEFRPVSYAELWRTLRELQYPVLIDIHKTVIWEDFLCHLEEYIVMNNGKLQLSEKTMLYIDHHQMLEDITLAYEDDAKRVYNLVTGRIQNFFQGDWKFNFQGRNSFQEIRRISWQFDKFYIFYQFFFSRNSLLSKDKFSLMLGVYPKNADSRNFVDWITENKPEIKELCSNLGMLAYPPKVEGTGAYILAFKDYKLTIDRQNVSTLDLQFIQAMEEFNRFTPFIDDAIQTYKNLNPHH